MHRVPILTFHAVETASSVLAFAPDALRGGPKNLAAHGFRSIDLELLAGPLAAGESSPARSLVLTFDDGYRSVYEHALPLLRELGWTATVFVTTGDGRGERPPSLTGRTMLSWRELAELARSGFTIGAHTRTHPDLTTLTTEALRVEMEGSQAILEDRLGVPVRTFAYPFGSHNARVRDQASELFDCACSVRLARVSRRSDRFALPRVEMYYLRRARRLALLASPAIDLVLALYAGPRALRSTVRSFAARRKTG